MDTDDSTIEAKCEHLMNIVVESRKRFGKMCIDYEQKTSLVENKMLNLQLETISNYKVKPKNTILNIDVANVTDFDDFSVEILEQQKRAENLRKRIKNTQAVVLQLKADSLGRRLREPLTAETMVAMAKSKTLKGY